MRFQCTKEAINIQFKALPSSGTAGQRRAFHCQVLLSPYSAELCPYSC